MKQLIHALKRALSAGKHEDLLDNDEVLMIQNHIKSLSLEQEAEKIHILQYHGYSPYSYDGTVEFNREYFLSRERLDQYVKDNRINMNPDNGRDYWATIETDDIIE